MEAIMKWLCSTCVLLVMLSSSAAAQQPPADNDTSGPRNSEFRPQDDVAASGNELRKSPVLDAKFWAVGGLLGTTMLLDTKSTFDTLGRCVRCYEANPYAAPFVNRGPAVAISAGMTFDIGVMAIAAKMKGSPQARFHRVWWVVPVALTAGHALAYRHNLGVAR
jgi:hypothetical protein